MTEERAEALRKLEERLVQVAQSTESLLREAPAGGQPLKPPPDPEPAPAGKPPPGGWQTPEADDRRAGSTGSELDALLAAIRSMRGLVPVEVVHRLAEALKEVLLALRALVDFYIERLERQPAEAPEVQDIPIQ